MSNDTLQITCKILVPLYHVTVGSGELMTVHSSVADKPSKTETSFKLLVIVGQPTK